MTLAALSPDSKLSGLASMVLTLQLMELQVAYWHGTFLSNKVDEADAKELEGLLHLLNGEDIM